jgi:hypothetical protein
MDERAEKVKRLAADIRRGATVHRILREALEGAAAETARPSVRIVIRDRRTGQLARLIVRMVF